MIPVADRPDPGRVGEGERRPGHRAGGDVAADAAQPGDDADGTEVEVGPPFGPGGQQGVDRVAWDAVVVVRHVFNPRGQGH